MFADTKLSTLDGNPRNAVAGGHKTQMHRVGYYEEDSEAKVAFPNDRAQSIRPEHDKYKYVRHIIIIKSDIQCSAQEMLIFGVKRNSFVKKNYDKLQGDRI